jgi:hypothetical protein
LHSFDLNFIGLHGCIERFDFCSIVLQMCAKPLMVEPPAEHYCQHKYRNK